MEDKIVYVPISVEDELPEISGRYVAYVTEITELGLSNFYWNCYFDDGTKNWSDNFITYHASHWLKPIPLSELLKEKDEIIKNLLTQISMIAANK